MTCPICNKETEQSYRPFCSKRCADIDLGKWFSGGYSVPSQREDEDPHGALDQAMEGSFESALDDGETRKSLPLRKH